MTIQKTLNGTTLDLAIEGRLDTVTAPELEAEASKSLEGIENLNVDMKQLEYISSAGLRVILSMQKQMNKQGKMVVKNVGPNIMEIFEITGFSDILTIE